MAFNRSNLSHVSHMNDDIYLSEEKSQELKKELEFLKSEKRLEISQRIEEAKKLGDLSENAEYMESREAQEQNERRILELEDTLKRSVIIQKTKATGRVQVGSTIKIKSDGANETYTIVGSEDADPVNGKISNASPLGRALLDKKEGETVEVKMPSGLSRKFVITHIS